MTSIYLTTEFVAPIVERFFEAFMAPKMRELGETDAAVWVAVVDPRRSFERRVLASYKRNVDPKKKFSGPCNRIARSKCEISSRTGLSSREVSEMLPHLLQTGDTAYAGSTVRGGLVVAISGLPDQWDEALSIQLWAEIWAEVMTLHVAMREELAVAQEHFLPKKPIQLE